MSKTSKPRPIIQLYAVGGAVRTEQSGRNTFMDVTFQCSFSESDKGVGGSSVAVDSCALHNVAQLAETAYTTIVKLLAGQQQLPRPK